MTLPSELADLATTEAQTVWLTLADNHYNATDRDTQLALSRVAYRIMAAGTVGQQIGAWQELCDAVRQWHRWDLVADSQGRHSELSLPSREAVQDHVVWALDDICRLAQAVA
jgi:hypothetical protein